MSQQGGDHEGMFKGRRREESEGAGRATSCLPCNCYSTALPHTVHIGDTCFYYFTVVLVVPYLTLFGLM